MLENIGDVVPVLANHLSLVEQSESLTNAISVAYATYGQLLSSAGGNEGCPGRYLLPAQEV